MRSVRVTRGLTLVDVLVGAGLMLVVFMGLFTLIRSSLQISGLAKLRASATAIASSQIEYLRSLPYDSIGTEGGIPAGTIPQYASSTNGGLVFDVRTYIEYADDAADGQGGADSNGITTDYKYLKVTVSYSAAGVTRDVTLVSNAVPKGIESTTGGGTLQAIVVDAVGSPVGGATVRIQNDTTSPTIDFTTFSDSYGIVYLPGAPTSTEYQVAVSKTGYSSDQTYARDATNVNPTPGYLTVVGGSTTSVTFAIDLLGTLTIRTFSPIAADSWSGSLDDVNEAYSATNIQVSLGSLLLSGAPGTYVSSGSALSTTTTPTGLVAWESAAHSRIIPAPTTLFVSVADSAGALIPDAVLPGNAAGFTGTIDLSGISTTTYPSLRLMASLTSSDPNVTPELTDWSISYTAGPTPLPDVPFTLTGAKTIGSTGGGAPIYKTEVSTTTNSSGVRPLSLEWDAYTIVFPSHTLVSSDPESPYELLPGASVSASVVLTP